MTFDQLTRATIRVCTIMGGKWESG